LFFSFLQRWALDAELKKNHDLTTQLDALRKDFEKIKKDMKNALIEERKTLAQSVKTMEARFQKETTELKTRVEDLEKLNKAKDYANTELKLHVSTVKALSCSEMTVVSLNSSNPFMCPTPPPPPLSHHYSYRTWLISTK